MPLIVLLSPPSASVRDTGASFLAYLPPLFKRSQVHDGQSETIPLAAIVGGTVGGALFATVAILGLFLLKKLLKQRTTEGIDVNCEAAKANTLKNPRRPTENAVLYRPLLSLSQTREAYLPFAEKGERDDSPTPVGTPIPEDKVLSLPVIAPLRVSKPKPLRTKRQHSQQLIHVERMAVDLERGPALAHKPSAISTSSMYSTASGEERTLQMPPNLLLAALEEDETNLAHRVSRTLPPVMSLKRSFLSRISDGHSANRLSQASSHQSMFTAASRDSSGAKIGVAV